MDYRKLITNVAIVYMVVITPCLWFRWNADKFQVHAQAPHGAAPAKQVERRLQSIAVTRTVPNSLPAPHVWILPSWEESYKTNRLAFYQQLLMKRGITNDESLRLLSGHLLAENGALAPDRHGDGGRSVGIPQRLVSMYRDPVTGKRFTAKTFLQRYPVWKTAKFQLTWMADRMIENIAKYGSVRLAIISHNMPACAARKCKDTPAGYFAKVQKQADRLSLQEL